MDGAIISAGIALGGTVVSILGSLLIARKTVNLELRKARIQFQQAFMGELLKKRLDNYPKIYSCLSELAREVREGRFSQQMIANAKEQLDKFDFEYALFFEQQTVNRCVVVRKMLSQLAVKNDQELSVLLSTEDARESFLDQIGKYELSLKSEIGIFGFDYQLTEGDLKARFLTSYDYSKWERVLEPIQTK